jgi:hypothetical protein
LFLKTENSRRVAESRPVCVGLYVRMVRLTARRVEWSSHQKWTNWVDPADWTERDLARMTPEAREDYERFILSDRPKYIPMKPEKLAYPQKIDKNMRTL